MPQSTTLPYPADMQIEELSHNEKLVLMTLRLWAIPHHSPHKTCPDWRTGLQQSGSGDQACAAMDALMNILLNYSTRLMDMRCTCNQQIGMDESCFLQIIALLQDNQHWEAQAILAEWVPLPVQGMALMCAMHLAESLRKAHVVLPLFRRQPAIVYEFEPFRLQRMQHKQPLQGDGIHLDKTLH